MSLLASRRAIVRAAVRKIERGPLGLGDGLEHRRIARVFDIKAAQERREHDARRAAEMRARADRRTVRSA